MAGHVVPSRSGQRTLELQRERAERLLNAVRALVLVLLAGAALVYASHIPPAVQRLNWLVLGPVLAWSLAQFALFREERRLPAWLWLANPLIDISAVTAILAGYGMLQSVVLALKSPIFLAYFVILAARPIASSTRRAAAVAAMVAMQYGALVTFFVMTGRVATTESPVQASLGASIAVLDEGAKILLLIVAGAVATYATAWHERLAQTYYRESLEREQLEVALAQAELQSLKLQLSPHFLFNTLNSISALITADPAAAERMLTGLSDFLRLSLHGSGAQEVPLERELQLLEHYLTIQQIRFADRLKVNISIGPGAAGALVPNLILQPLAENAIKHGLAPRKRGGRIEIRAQRENGSLVLRVADDGLGRAIASDGSVPAGIGLGNTRARLAHLYGSGQRLEIVSAPERGFAVTITIPYHTTGDGT